MVEPLKKQYAAIEKQGFPYLKDENLMVLYPYGCF